MRVKGWSGRSELAKVDIYTRVTAYLLVWASVFVDGLLLLTRPVRADGPAVLVVLGPLLVISNGVLCHRFARRAMDAYLGKGEVGRRRIGAAAATTTALTGSILVIASTADVTGMLPMMLGSALVPFFTGHCLIVPRWTIALHQLLTLAVVSALLPLTGRDTPQVLVTAVTVGFVIGCMAGTVRVSVWVLGVLWELREARDTQARLAVAEERLRFGRDMHDVLGRNLAVIALKSELAVQLARRGRPEAVDQMTEVQRIAQESQREVRDVVRGYREADLRVELEGARGVLTAAGIVCEIDQVPAVLPVGAQSALGWVVREATTNVLRHGDARRCVISVTAADDAVVLVVENDGAGGAGAVAGAGGSRGGAASGFGPVSGGGAGAGGSGLAGLRERLAAVDGTLEAGPAGDGRFRVTARIALAPTPLEAAR